MPRSEGFRWFVRSRRKLTHHCEDERQQRESFVCGNIRSCEMSQSILRGVAEERFSCVERRWFVGSTLRSQQARAARETAGGGGRLESMQPGSTENETAPSCMFVSGVVHFSRAHWRNAPWDWRRSGSTMDEERVVVPAEVIEKVVFRFMGGEGGAVRSRVKELAKMARCAVAEGGGSRNDFDCLIDELMATKELKMKKEHGHAD
ncbi:uncharacterized protein A4U43_C08F19140 [Asparagus officinalis]|nr:uncharacterized protein A4U43_C08F19140 [Asparagus officinalis]